MIDQVAPKNSLFIYLKFLSYILQSFHDTILTLEGDSVVIADTWDVMCNLRQKLVDRFRDKYFGWEASELLKNQTASQSSRIEKDFTQFISRSLTYLEKWFDFSENNYIFHLKPLINPSQITFNQLRDIAEKLGVNRLLDMDSLYEECCRLQISPLQISGRSTLDKWVQIFKNFPNHLSNIYCILFICVQYSSDKRLL